jgi:hypothetical protein
MDAEPSTMMANGIVLPIATELNNKGDMSMAAKKPKGWNAFNELAKQLAGVDKTKVDKKIATDKAKRIKKRAKKK